MALVENKINMFEEEDVLEKIKRMQDAVGLGPKKEPETLSNLEDIDQATMMSNYNDMIRRKIKGAEGRLTKAEDAYGTSQKAGEGWGGFAAKAGGVFADTLSGLAGKKGGYTKGVLGQFDKTKARGAKAYETALGKEKGYVEEMSKLEKQQSSDANSDESKSARMFAKEIYGIDLPENTNAIQAKVYMDMYAKKNQMKNVEDWKKANFEQRERAISGKALAAKEKPSEFEKVTEKKQAERYATTQEAIPTIAKNIAKVDAALDAQLKYSSESWGGTGPIATLGGLTKYASSETQNLEAIYRDINLKNMVSTFSGMSKAVDSDAERRAWEATQASLSNDDEVNLNIIMGMKSTLLKDQAVAKAQTEWVREHGDLTGFEQANPILRGEITTIVDPNGEMQLVDKQEAAQLEKQGYRSLDSYVEAMVENKYKKPEPQRQSIPQGKPEIGKIVIKNGKRYKKVEGGYIEVR